MAASATANPAPTTVLVVDDHPAVRLAMRRLLESLPGVDVVGEAATLAEAESVAGALHPAVTLLDISLPGESGLDGVPQLKRLNPGGRVVMFSLHDEPAYERIALREGADGYVVKDDPTALLEAVRAYAC
jgi:two-component system, NarL family, invasion response regulator UvrY